MKSLYLLTMLAILAFATQADAQGPLRRLLFGQRFAAPSCSNGQCEVMPAPAVAPVKPVCPCGKAECPLCCPDGKCCEVPGAVGDALIPMRALDGKTFAGALQGRLATAKTLKERRLLNIINGPDSPRRDRQIARMERLVRAELNVGPAAAIDWQSIDWAAILRFLLTILPLFL